MNDQRLYIGGELYLRLETVAELYSVRAIWLREACDRGLIGPATPHGAHLCLAALELDRIALLVHMHVTLGLDLSRIAREWSEFSPRVDSQLDR